MWLRNWLKRKSDIVNKIIIKIDVSILKKSGTSSNQSYINCRSFIIKYLWISLQCLKIKLLKVNIIANRISSISIKVTFHYHCHMITFLLSVFQDWTELKQTLVGNQSFSVSFTLWVISNWFRLMELHSLMYCWSRRYFELSKFISSSSSEKMAAIFYVVIFLAVRM